MKPNVDLTMEHLFHRNHFDGKTSVIGDDWDDILRAFIPEKQVVFPWERNIEKIASCITTHADGLSLIPTENSKERKKELVIQICAFCGKETIKFPWSLTVPCECKKELTFPWKLSKFQGESKKIAAELLQLLHEKERQNYGKTAR